MACTYTGSLEGDRAYSAEQRVKALTTQLDKVTRLLCFTTVRFEKVAPSVWGGLLQQNSELATWVEAHKAEDEEKWFNHYRGQYPNFSKEEIAKMVRNEVLPIP